MRGDHFMTDEFFAGNLAHWHNSTRQPVTPEIYLASNQTVVELRLNTFVQRLETIIQEHGGEVPLANKIGVTQPAIDRWRHAKQYPRLRELIKLTEALSISADWLIGKENIMAERIQRVECAQSAGDDTIPPLMHIIQIASGKDGHLFALAEVEETVTLHAHGTKQRGFACKVFGWNWIECRWIPLEEYSRKE
jgi:transcriptional regulator with XRE-family HTH domain